MKKIILFVMLSFLMLINITNACEEKAKLPWVPPELSSICIDEGPFVTKPTEFGFFSFALLGVGLYPFEAFCRISLDYGSSPDYTLGTMGRLGAYSFFIPTYILKKIFCDAPIYVWEAITEGNKTSYKTDFPDSEKSSPEI